MYYRDPCAEDKGIMDGVIDLNTVTAVMPLQVARNYGFQTVVSVIGVLQHSISKNIPRASKVCFFFRKTQLQLHSDYSMCHEFKCKRFIWNNRARE